MSFATFIGNEHIRGGLQRALRNNSLPHAYIFYGPEGVGKRTLALILAKSLNCLNLKDDSCDECRSCRKIDKGLHPDVRLLLPGGKVSLSIDQMRGEIRRTIYLKPLEGRKRVYIIDEAEKMTPEAANSLLKTLEEPPPAALLILLTTSYPSLLPTIRSRCQALRFSSISREDIREFLIKRCGSTMEKASYISELAEGSLGKASTMDPQLIADQQKEMVSLAGLLLNGGNLREILEEASRFAREKSEKREREKMEAKLLSLAGVFRDLMILSSGGDRELLINKSNKEELASLAKKVDKEDALHIVEEVYQALVALRRNANRKLLAEALFLHINQIARRRGLVSAAAHF